MDTLQIDITSIIIFAVGVFCGFALALLYARMHYKNKWMQAALKAKNPELWDLAHFLATEEDEAKKIKETTRQQVRRPDNPSKGPRNAS